MEAAKTPLTKMTGYLKSYDGPNTVNMETSWHGLFCLMFESCFALKNIYHELN